MKKLLILMICVSFLINAPAVLADDVGNGRVCKQGISRCLDGPKGEPYSCQPSTVPGSQTVIFQCLPSVGKVFGNITPPNPIAGFIAKDPTGATAISKFLSNLIQLVYIFAAIALLFVLFWGAFDWIVSEGDKEKVASAQRKIINAVIGIVLFAVAFAVLKVLGDFTGFQFFQINTPTCAPRQVGAWLICL